MIPPVTRLVAASPISHSEASSITPSEPEILEDILPLNPEVILVPEYHVEEVEDLHVDLHVDNENIAVSKVQND